MKRRSECALITGASTGLGREFARLAAADGYDLILVSRDAQRLEAVASELQRDTSVDVMTNPCDLSVAGAAPALYSQVKSRGRTVDILINNAGFGKLGYFSQHDADDIASMIQTNVTALTLLTRLFLDDMLARKHGKILNVASLAAYTPGPLMAVYHATKSYVLALTEAVAEEVRGSGVSATVLVPGITRTEFQARAGIPPASVERGAMSAAAVARAGYHAMLDGKTVCVAGMGNRVLGFLAHHAPHSISLRVAHTMQRKLLR
ncbi:MAG: SDR family oxidoreductase [Candidatus Eremiobacteraeota bacterium]|nr:SDR family oxidoreductase [Candidatus Eremiobacteraeota bacterium]